MKQKLSLYLSLFLCFTLIFTACKKDDNPAPAPSTEVEVAAQADDEAMVSDEIDAIAADANALVEADASLSGDNSVLDEVICDATVAVNAETDPMTLTVTFNGANCGGKRTRTGVVILSMAKGSHWKDEGASITVKYQDLKVTRKSDGKHITFNGSYVYTNVSGGLVYEAASLGTIIHTITSSDLSVKFEDGTTRTWNIARKKEFTFDNGLVITVKGTHTEGDDTTVTIWGNNRFGNAFTTSIAEPVILKQSCDFRVTGGTIKHKTSVFTATAVFGLDATGNVTGCPGTGNFYYKLGWTNNSNGNDFSIILPY